MTLASDSFPSSPAFDLIAASLTSPAAKSDALKKGKAIFAFTLTNKAQETESWYLDLKTTGTVGKGLAPEGAKPDVVLSLSDDDFQDLVDGKLAAQKLFMGGRLKIKGDVMKATRAEGVLKAARGGGSKL
ncbi:sterol-binding-like protein [Choiromyces venosus 120613-1]|uniref:Sterol-binding-like protein n=1 Tax=Choiromyces venosus 120613-1 TaxID=1336337 RepID=A0A3N4JAD5_9PEZI|nr:sterol-binding-like protein [Choiromyces venosus 120613-1]